MFKTKLFDKGAKGRGSVELPDGKYLFRIEKAEVRSAKTGRTQVNLRLTSLEGEVKGATAWDTWNIVQDNDSDKAKEVMQGFWVDVTSSWPDVYNAEQEVLHEEKFEGRTFWGTVHHEADKNGKMQPKMKSHKFIPVAGVAAGTAAPQSEEASKPQKFATP